MPGLLQAVETLVRGVGGYQLQHFRCHRPGGGEAKNLAELVSEVDRESEQRLLEGLTRLLPHAGVFGEESGRSGDPNHYWIVDPLDGTTNYLSGLDQFSISVALCHQGRIDLGVVYRPANGELFSAERGGVFCHNGQPCQQADHNLELSQALLGTGFPYRSPDLAAAFFQAAATVLPRGRGIRRMGSAALDLAYVAAGYLQGFWESDLQPYDVAAGLLFLEMAGCPVTNAEGLPYRMGADRLLLCGWPAVHAELQPLIESAYRAKS